MRHWECESNENTFLVIDDKGGPRRSSVCLASQDSTMCAAWTRAGTRTSRRDLPGQEKNPIFDEA